MSSETATRSGTSQIAPATLSPLRNAAAATAGTIAARAPLRQTSDVVAASSASSDRRVELLHPAPERVPVEERRGGCRRRDERPQPTRAYDSAYELVENECEERAEEREVRLPGPGGIEVDESREAEREEAADG